MQGLSAQILPVCVELVRELYGFLKHLLPRGLAELDEGLFVVVNQQHLFHEEVSINIG
jgi:hypothetical protein